MFDSFDSDSRARLAILGELQEPNDKAFLEKTIKAVVELTAEETYHHDACDNHDSVGFDLSVERHGTKCLLTLVTHGSTIEPSDNCDDNTHALPKKLRELLKIHKATSFEAQFSGGGDSGQCDSISVTDINGDEVADSDLKVELEALADKVSGGVWIDWYNNEGGGGTLLWNKPARRAESSFYSNAEVELPETTIFEVELAPEPVVGEAVSS